MSTPVMSLKNVTIQFGGVKALNDVSFDINKQEILGLIGPNGAGKTTVFNVVTGVYQISSGVIEFQGKSLAGVKRYRITRGGIARTFQNIRLWGDMTSLENYTNILFLKLEETMDFQLKTYLGQGYWGHTYVTFDGIYFAGNSYRFNDDTDTYESLGMLIRYQLLDDGSMTFGGYQTYQGYVINQFAIADHFRPTPCPFCSGPF